MIACDYHELELVTLEPKGWRVVGYKLDCRLCLAENQMQRRLERGIRWERQSFFPPLVVSPRAPGWRCQLPATDVREAHEQCKARGLVLVLQFHGAKRA